MVDSNNNSPVGKYSLRPRSESKKSAENCAEEDVKSQLACKPKTRTTSRQRSQPLSKYRRRSANARERSRMREINEAFETLRRMVSWGSEHQTEKMTKISTLRLAMGYIAAMSDALRTPAGGVAEETLYDAASMRTGYDRFECARPSAGFQNYSRMSATSSLACGANSSPSLVKSNDFTREAVSRSTVCEKSVFIQMQTNTKHETIGSSTDGFLQDVNLSITHGYDNDKVSSLPRTIDSLVDELNLQITKETVSPSDVSPVGSFYSIETLEKSSATDFCKKNDKQMCEKTLLLNASFEKRSVLDSVQQEYEDSFLSVEEGELGNIQMVHSLEDLFD